MNVTKQNYNYVKDATWVQDLSLQCNLHIDRVSEVRASLILVCLELSPLLMFNFNQSSVIVCTMHDPGRHDWQYKTC